MIVRMAMVSFVDFFGIAFKIGAGQIVKAVHRNWRRRDLSSVEPDAFPRLPCAQPCDP